MIYNKNNLIIQNIINKNEARTELTGILVKKDRTVATDSFCLIEVKNVKPLAENKDIPALQGVKNLTSMVKQGQIVPTATIKKVLGNLKENKDLPILENCFLTHTKNDKTQIQFTTTDLKNENNVLSKTIDEKFPDYEKIIPPERGIKITLDLKILKKVIDVLNKMDLADINNNSAEIFITNSNKPILIKTKTKQEQEVRAVIMPIRQ